MCRGLVSSEVLCHNARLLVVGGAVPLLLFAAYVGLQPDWQATASSDETVDILLILDHDYGANVPFIMAVFSRYGWNVTTTGPEGTLISCDYLGETLDVDILLGGIGDVTQFDAISVMPGESHGQLRTSQAAQDLIQEAMEQHLIVSAWCRAVRVLAAADILGGKNITGHPDYETEYTAAGATFNELVPPVIDENLVTCVRSRFYRNEMCQAIASALGVYEQDPPILESVTVSPNPITVGTNACLEIHLSDAHSIYIVSAKVFELNASGLRASEVHLRYFELNRSGVEGVYNGSLVDLSLGRYTLDIYAWDSYLNEVVYSYAINFTVSEQSASLPWLFYVLVPVGVGGSALIVVLAIILLKRR